LDYVFWYTDCNKLLIENLMDQSTPKIIVPKGFFWGASTSAHQVEGGNHNDWTEWEKKHAPRLASEARAEFGHLPSWSAIEKEATNPENYISGTVIDHFNRYKEDFDLARELGHNAHRLSIEWARIEPEEGHFDQVALQHYLDVITACRERGMEPFVTLWHWTMPLWLAEKGGFTSSSFPKHFETYTEVVVKALGSEVKYWITLNEPDVVSSHSYLRGVWPPQQKSYLKLYRAVNTLIKAHKLSYKKIKSLYPEVRVGIAKHQVVFHVARKTIINRTLKAGVDYIWNRWILNQIKNEQDFIGLNHYHQNTVNNGYNKNPNKRLTDMGWQFLPHSLYQAIMELRDYQKPIYITENGLADAADTQRAEFITEALGAVSKAIADGADVRGYLHWSLLDNFEWDKGYWPKFGLIAIDRTTMVRTVRPSALVYRDIIKNSTL
jgi:beta-glucosidase